MKEIDIDKHVSEFKEQGFAVLPEHFNAAKVALLKGTFDRLSASGVGSAHVSWWLSNLVEYEPQVMMPFVSDPAILEFAENVMGPCVQLDNLTLSGFPSVTKEEAVGRASGWHRDRWAQVPLGDQYSAPLAINAISYLQDLTDEYGPLRVVPGSHRRQYNIPDGGRPVEGEVILHAKAGDVVIIHNCLLHSGTPNWSGKTRYFYSIFYNRTWLKPTDDHSGPNVQRIVADAREGGDKRTMRLFGVDEDLKGRCNWGFQRDEEGQWARWRAEEAAGAGSGGG